MSSSASTDTFPALPADVAATRRASGITIAPEAALHRALQERTDELERVRAELGEALARIDELEQARDHHCTKARILQQMLDAAPPTAPDVLTPAEARAVEAVRERDRLDAAIRELAGTINEHDDSADLFDSEEESLASVRAVVEEFLRAHGHPVADERATRRFAPPTAPDVGSTTSAPAAGAADPRPGRTPDEIRAWSTGLFGG